MGRGIVSKIAHWTLSLILKQADLQPLLENANPEGSLCGASKILWCYEQLASRGEVVIGFDEKPQLGAGGQGPGEGTGPHPKLQALERRRPKQGMQAAQSVCQSLYLVLEQTRLAAMGQQKRSMTTLNYFANSPLGVRS